MRRARAWRTGLSMAGSYQDGRGPREHRGTEPAADVAARVSVPRQHIDVEVTTPVILVRGRGAQASCSATRRPALKSAATRGCLVTASMVCRQGERLRGCNGSRTALPQVAPNTGAALG